MAFIYTAGYAEEMQATVSTLRKGTMAVSYPRIKPVTFRLQDQLLTHYTTVPLISCN
uniref:Uncharacterized protein n=1 Tax=Anguilla anguilla TaxID=7936 RepID=A0A0E9PTV5_ANGAN